MTDATIVALATALLTAIPPTLVAYAALQQGRRNGEDVKTTAQKADVIIEKAVGIQKQTDGVNSNLTQALAVANQKIQGLETMLGTFLKKNGTHDEPQPPRP